MSRRPGLRGHTSFTIQDGDRAVRCMAYEPTKNFREIVRQLRPGDTVIACGSYKKGSINLEKMNVVAPGKSVTMRPPVCTACSKRMTSDGKGKGWKCKKCGARSGVPDVEEIIRTLKPGGMSTADRKKTSCKTVMPGPAGITGRRSPPF